MTVAEGLTVSLVAAEPLVRQPVAIEFDDRGRLWVIQYLQYPNPAGLTRVSVDRYSRTVYDRVPEPPPHGPRGADRITILSDSDGDGRADRARDFVDGLNLATGLAFGHGGVFVLNVPYLLFYADRDRDDAPDGNPEVLLAGFGMEDAHSVANSLTWGPDGWLYGCQGSTVTANIRGIEFQQGVWRYHPTSREFELFCEGGGNSWGLDFDRHGQLLYSTNFGGYVCLHGVQGAYLTKNFGKHGALHNPHAYGFFEHVPHAGFHGGHVTCGGMIYQADLLPEQYRGAYIAANLLGHGVYWHTLSQEGSTFRSAHGGELLVASDPWFAPCDVTTGPDGAIYVADWHDQRTAHPDPDADWDRTNGRIYRIAPAADPASPAVDLGGLGGPELVAHLDNSNDWTVDRARRLLGERRDTSLRAALRERLSAPDAHRAIQSLWALYTTGDFDEGLAAPMLESRDPHLRRWSVRFLGDSSSISQEMASRLDRLAEIESDAAVRAQLACTARRLPAEQALPIVHSILLRDQDLADPHIPLLLWWAVERHAVSAADEVLARFADPAEWSFALTREVILPRLVRRYAAEGTQETLAHCLALLEAAPSGPERVALLASLDAGLQDRGVRQGAVPLGDLFRSQAIESAAPPPDAVTATRPLGELAPGLVACIAERWREAPDDPTLIRLAIRIGIQPAYDLALAQATDRSLAIERRVEALGILAELGRNDAVPAMLALADASEPEGVQQSSLAVLGRFDDERIAPVLLARYASFDGTIRARVRDVLLGRVASAAALVAAVDRGQIDPSDVPFDQVRRVALLGDARLDAIVRRLWGNVQPGTAEEKLAEMRRLSNDLRAASGDAVLGKDLFKKHCATCHVLFGDGSKVGPDLTSANRSDRDYLLVSLVDPSVVVRKEYMSYVVQTLDGRVLTGLLAEETPAAVTLLDAKNQRLTVPRGEIETLAESPLSLMPERIHKDLSPQDLRNLFQYLQSPPPSAP
jgi:putative membrane-bound dehydrogenase-like protein